MPATTPTPVLLKGVLKKKSPKGIAGLRAWQKRHFFLFETQLAYSKTDDLAKVQGAIPLADVTAIDSIHGKPTRIRIEVANRRFDLDAGSPEASENWIVALNQRWGQVKAAGNSCPTSTSNSPTAQGKFWKLSSSCGTINSMGSSSDNLSAPSISTGLNSKAFTPINMSSIRLHSGHFGTVGRRTVKSHMTSNMSSDGLFFEEDSPSSSLAIDFSVDQIDYGARASRNPKMSFLKRAMDQSPSLTKNRNLFAGDTSDADTAVGYADFDRTEKMADCRIGSLYLANLKPTDQMYLLQVVMKRDDHYETGAALIKLMMKAELQHPFFVRLVFSGVTPDRSWAAYTFIKPNQTLLDRLRSCKRLTEDIACTYLAQIVLFISFLHQSGRLFNKMCPESIGFDEADQLLIVNFETIAFSSAEAAELARLPPGDDDKDLDEFWTPELIAGHGETILSDWWRLGSLLYELLVGFPPFRAKTRTELLARIQDGVVRYPPFISDGARDFIERCLTRDPNHRLGVDIVDVLSHPFFQNVNWTLLHWRGLTRLLGDGISDAPVRVKICVKEGGDLPDAVPDPTIRLTYGDQSFSTSPSSNAKCEFRHDAVAAAYNCFLKVELCVGQVIMASASEPVDLGIRGAQRRSLHLCNGAGVLIAVVSLDVKVKDQAGKRSQVDDDYLVSSSKRVLKRSVSTISSKGSPRSRRASVLAMPKPHRRGTILENVSVKLSGKLRSLVSKNKLRFQVDGFDLDLTYLTSQLIVMGFPSSSLEGVFRNPMEEVQRFVKTYHEGHCRVVNLCSERSYDPASFDHNVACFPFDDHNPPPLAMILEFCRHVKAYLDADPENVVAIHCKAGKGRTGVMATSYLLYTGQKATPADALAFFAEQRTADGRGVTVPSQIRAVHTFEKLLQITSYDTKPIALDSAFETLVLIRMHPEPDLSPLGGCDPFCRVYRRGCLIYDSSVMKAIIARPAKNTIDLPMDCVVNGDVKLVMYHKTAAGKKHMFSFWINVDFIENHYVQIEKSGLDKAEKNSKFDSSFRVEVFLKAAESGNLQITEGMTVDPSSEENTEDDLTQCSLSESTFHHRCRSEGAQDLTRWKSRRKPSFQFYLPEVVENPLQDPSSLVADLLISIVPDENDGSDADAPETDPAPAFSPLTNF